MLLADSIERTLMSLRVASGDAITIAGHVVERPHVGYWSLTPRPEGWGGDGVYPLDFVADYLAGVTP